MSALNRLAKGYEPRWDIDRAVGAIGEDLVGDVIAGLVDGSTEVKTDERALHTGRIYIEHACLIGGKWERSGIETTEADYWAIVLGRRVVVAIPVSVIRAIHGAAIQRRAFAECPRGSHPTKGVTVPISELLHEAIQIAGGLDEPR